jgi:hypothetical protein
MAKRADMIIAETFGWDYKEVQECRYQRYVSSNVYSIGDRYFAVSKTKPKHSDVGDEWVEHTDQFGARNTDKKIWVCNSVCT